jgi:hypothetical protein
VDTAIAVTRSNGTVVYANALLTRLTGKPATNPGDGSMR